MAEDALPGSVSSSSHVRRRGHARASASWAISTVSSCAVTRRARTSRSTIRSRPASPRSVRSRDPTAHRIALDRRSDQPQQERTQQGRAARTADCRRAGPPNARRRRGSRPTRDIPRRQHVAVAPTPCLHSAWDSSGNAPARLRVANHEVDEAVFKTQAGQLGGPLDRLFNSSPGEGRHEVQTLPGHRTQRRVLGEARRDGRRGSRGSPSPASSALDDRGAEHTTTRRRGRRRTAPRTGR